MSDLWDLGDDDEPPRRPLRPTVRRRRRLAALAVVAAVLAVIVFGVIALARFANGLFGGTSDYAGSGSGSVAVVIHQGDSISTIGDTLASAGVVASSSAFSTAAAANPRSSDIGPGTYRLHHHMAASRAVSLLLSPSSLVDYKVAIPEGFTAQAIVARVAADAHISTASLQAAIRSPGSLGLPPYANGHVEGFLFPATYDVQPGSTATQVLSSMVARFQVAAKADGLISGAAKVGLTPYQVLILASMVQREGRLVADYPKIAEVFLNRLHRHMRLDSDATLYYVLGPDHGPLTTTDLARATPYNTRKYVGLPPTPINSPGDAAILAVLHHATGPYLYFVTIDKAGHTAFATTLSQFNGLVARSRANGVS